MSSLPTYTAGIDPTLDEYRFCASIVIFKHTGNDHDIVEIITFNGHWNWLKRLKKQFWLWRIKRKYGKINILEETPEGRKKRDDMVNGAFKLTVGPVEKMKREKIL